LHCAGQGLDVGGHRRGPGICTALHCHRMHHVCTTDFRFDAHLQPRIARVAACRACAVLCPVPQAGVGAPSHRKLVQLLWPTTNRSGCRARSAHCAVLRSVCSRRVGCDSGARGRLNHAETNCCLCLLHQRRETACHVQDVQEARMHRVFAPQARTNRGHLSDHKCVELRRPLNRKKNARRPFFRSSRHQKCRSFISTADASARPFPRPDVRCKRKFGDDEP
jgi:hypothetical protein